MKKAQGWIMFALLLLAVAGIATSATLLLKRGAPVAGDAYYAFSGTSGGRVQRYEKKDYEWAAALGKAGYKDKTVEQFTGSVCDWQDEEAFHKAEEIVRNLRWGLEEDDPQYAFVDGPLKAAMDILSCRHYAGACKRWTPSYSDAARFEKKADVYGDAYTVFQATAAYTIHYEIPDEGAVTMGELEAVLAGYREGMTAFLDGRTEKQLKDEKAMEKKAAEQLRRLDRELTTDKIRLGESQLDDYSAWD